MHFSFFKFYCFIDKFEDNFIKELPKNVSLIYRNYNKLIDIKTIKKIKNSCRKRNIKFYLSNNIKLAIKLNLDGVYLPSFNKSYYFNSFNLKQNFILMGSAHNCKEIRQKERQNVEIIFLSPIYQTKKKKPLGLYRFMNLMKLTEKKVICLGGINRNNLNTLKNLNIFAIGGISLFRKNINHE